MYPFRVISASVLLLFVSFVYSGCSKDPYIPELQGPPPVCLLSGYNCVVSNGGVQSLTGTVNYEYYLDEYSEDEYFLKYRETNNICSFEFEDNDDYLSYSWNVLDYRIFFYGNNWPQTISYYLGNNTEVDVVATYGSSSRLTRLQQETENIFNPGSDRIRRIDDITYSNGNLVSYRYRESLANSPFTVLFTEYYEISYDFDYEYDKKAFLNEKLYAILPRPLLGSDFSFGETFNPQFFSKNLVLEKRRVNDNAPIFANTYSFDADSNITRLTQAYPSGVGIDPATLTWTYQYRCE